MDIKQLSYFIQIAESNTITEASKKLHIAQPALSQSLKTLEDMIGTPLINRDKRQHSLTLSGEILYQEAKSILEKIAETKFKLQVANQNLLETIKIGLDPVSSRFLLPVIPQMKRDYPNIKLTINQNSSLELTQMVHQGTLDLAFVVFPVDTKHLETVILEEEPFYFICSKSDKNNTGIEIKPPKIDLPLILPGSEHQGTYQSIWNHFNQLSSSLSAISDCSDVDLLLSMVEEDLGYSVVPQSFLTKSNYKLDVLPITNVNFSSTHGLIYSKEKKLSTAFSHFLDLLIQLNPKPKTA